MELLNFGWLLVLPPRLSLPGDRGLFALCIIIQRVSRNKEEKLKLLFTAFFFFFFCKLSYPRLKTPLNPKWEQIFKCQGQLQSDSLKVPGLKILVRPGEQGERNCPPAVQIEIIEIVAYKTSLLKPAIPLLPDNATSSPMVRKEVEVKDWEGQRVKGELMWFAWKGTEDKWLA